MAVIWGLMIPNDSLAGQNLRLLKRTLGTDYMKMLPESHIIEYHEAINNSQY
jgi:hypothetical protein